MNNMRGFLIQVRRTVFGKSTVGDSPLMRRKPCHIKPKSPRSARSTRDLAGHVGHRGHELPIMISPLERHAIAGARELGRARVRSAPEFRAATTGPQKPESGCPAIKVKDKPAILGERLFQADRARSEASDRRRARGQGQGQDKGKGQGLGLGLGIGAGQRQEPAIGPDSAREPGREPGQGPGPAIGLMAGRVASGAIAERWTPDATRSLHREIDCELPLGRGYRENSP
jgi:hypothetical protein